MIIDIHTHFFPQVLIDQARNGKAVDGLSILDKGNKEFIQHRQGARYPLAREFYDREAKLEKMNALDIDISILSAAPPLFMYWLDKNEEANFAPG
jgi:aminocarboxymuconate-semialdehyde decarboxylase